MKIKILYIYPNMNIGGAQKVVVDLINNINDSDFEIYLACSGGQYLDLIDKDVKVILIDFDKKNFYKSIWQIRKLIKDKEIDIIHSHHRYTTALSNFAKINTKTKVIHSEHSTFKSKNFINLRGKNIIAVSEGVRKNLIDNGIKARNIELIYNGIEEEEYLNVKIVNLKKQLNINFFTFGFIGRLSEEKGIIYMLEAFNNLIKKGIKCNLIIIGDGKLREEIESYIKNNKLSENIFLIGFRNDIKNIIKSLDMYILPSLVEGFPITNMEIMINSRTVIATNVGGNKEIIDNGINGFIIEPKNVKELEDTIHYVLKNVNILNSLNKNAKNTVLKKFTMSEMKRKHIDYYKALI